MQAMGGVRKKLSSWTFLSCHEERKDALECWRRQSRCCLSLTSCWDLSTLTLPPLHERAARVCSPIESVHSLSYPDHICSPKINQVGKKYTSHRIHLCTLGQLHHDRKHRNLGLTLRVAQLMLQGLYNMSPQKEEVTQSLIPALLLLSISLHRQECAGGMQKLSVALSKTHCAAPVPTGIQK